MTTTCRVSVVIGTLNQCETLQKVLPFYEKQEQVAGQFELIIVDSTSTDGSHSFLSQYTPTYPFRYIQQPNTGKAAARNRAAREASGEILLITDADMIPHPGLIRAHIEAHTRYNAPVCLEGVAWNLAALTWPPDMSKATPQVGTHPASGKRLGWYYFLTGNVSLPKEVFDEENGFNEIFKGYGWEDLELGYRLSQRNIPLYYLREAQNYHYHVINQDDDIVRHEPKGKSARIMLALHPTLRWFLGFNPFSCWVFAAITEQSWLYRAIRRIYDGKKSGKIKAIAHWFLKEHRYHKGARSV